MEILTREFLEYARRTPVTLSRATISGRTILDGKTVHIPDILSEPEMKTAYQVRGQHRTGLGVPLSKKGEVIGVFALVRYQVRPFMEKEIELVTTFADQAVIAIENTRLLTELRKRTDQLEAQSQELANLKPTTRATRRRPSRRNRTHEQTAALPAATGG
jgi:GAF domain-containing protein